MNNEMSQELPLRAFADLKGKKFLIPYQQRGYKWTTSNVEELLNDLRDFIYCSNQKKRVYCLQPLSVVDMADGRYSVIDGQQRLTTLYLLYVFLNRNAPYSIEYERDDASGKQMSRTLFLRNIASVKQEDGEKNADFYYIYMAFHHIEKVFEKWECVSSHAGNQEHGKDELDVKALFRNLLECCNDEKSIQVIWYEVAKEKQYDTFRNLNSGKIHLTNTDLIKALLLNRVSGLPGQDRLEAAAVFEHMEMEMQNDHFWYMINGSELREGQTRMDFLFNLVAGCKQADYDTDSRWSFRNYFSKPEAGTLSEKWKAVRHTFLRLKDMYDDACCYHYIGFLTYNSNRDPISSMQELLKLNRECKHSQFVDKLRKEIKGILNKDNHEAVTDYVYKDNQNKKPLRLLFLMHNIETILQRFERLRQNKKIRIDSEYERFPFELLHKHKWDIEHIASKTESDFKSPTDRDDWLRSIKQDLGESYPAKDVEELEKKYENSGKREDFNILYNAIMRKCDEQAKDAIKDDAPEGRDKMQVGNLTLLDSHTNKSYHNALFPRKRRYIIVADGLVDEQDEFETGGIQQFYVPPCTRQVFTKAYNKSNNLSLNVWTQTDAEMYVKDMEQKLSYYFDKGNKTQD